MARGPLTTCGYLLIGKVVAEGPGETAQGVAAFIARWDGTQLAERANGVDAAAFAGLERIRTFDL